MSETIFFPFGEYWWIYLAFLGLVATALALDLGVFHRKAHEVSFREAATWSGVWVGLALLFNLGFYYYTLHRFESDPSVLPQGVSAHAQAKELALEFLTGFIVEKSLAIDNIFIFIVVFQFFAIPTIYQHRVLFYGIFGAIFFRGIFIAIGSALMAYKGVVIFFGIFLGLTGIKMLFAPEKPLDPEKNWVVKLVRKWIPVTPTIEGPRFFVFKNGIRHATPLFLALVFLELTDIIFAVDSVPAIYAITDETLIVFTSNIMAILGLRSLYFLLGGFLSKFRFLKYGLALVLVFVGLKMAWLNEVFGGKFPTGLSLGIIAGLIGGSVLVSILTDKKKA